MTDYFELHEIDIRDVQMRIFSQTVTGDVRTWFRSLPPNSIDSLDVFYQQFLNRWEKKNNPLQIISKYENLKRGPNETVQDYCTRFNNVYNAIPLDLRPPPGLALIKFPDEFDTDMAFRLRERNPPTLEDMKSVVVSVEANLLSKSARVRNERRAPLKDEISPFDQKMDALAKGMEKLMDRIDIIERKCPTNFYSPRGLRPSPFD